MKRKLNLIEETSYNMALEVIRLVEELGKKQEAQIKELSPADLNELEEDLDKILEIIDGVEDALDPEMPGYTLERNNLRKAVELIGGIKYTLGLMGSGRA